ncbi:MAG: aminopeptidase P N-terminal domain-containing protein [Rhodocyclaceae bacterium]|nr:aminopeptidase P N-terminal domain-containing protein [Rhodocyclaceae bacterium]MCB1962428.1 aminopeptidase P N-terminal domain-containing protein [Rhodocyclaceae bacterium]
MTAAGGGIAIVPTAREMTRNRDTHFPFRADSYFYYLTGFTEPDAVLLLIAGETPRSVLFCREKNLEREIWEGFRYGPEAACTHFGVDEAWPIDEFDGRLAPLLADQPAIFFTLGHDSAWDRRVVDALNRVREQVRTGIAAPASITDLHRLIDEMRLIKDSHEVATMRRAAAISGEAHRQAMRTARPGQHEYMVEAELLHQFRRAGAQSPAYPSIVASGANACVLHYVSNDCVMRDGDLLLIDAGCELDGYASDITRSFPVNGRFSGPQRDVYQLVLDAQSAAIAATRPGAAWNAPHDAAVAVLAQGMIDLGLLSGSLDGVLESAAYTRFYMHRTGHWLGLDVHDAGDYKLAGAWRPLREGMTLTVEPGCYIRPADDVPEALWNIGVRIEDDALVTAAGCELLSADTPKTIDDIEALMRGA